MSDMPPKDDPAALTLFIEKCYHQPPRDQLPDLACLAHKVERVHAKDPDGLGDLLQRLIGELEVPIKREELILFPAILRGGKAGIEAPSAALRADHDAHGADIARFRTLTNNLILPDGGLRVMDQTL